MAQSQNVIREIIVGNAIASETTLPTFLSTASPLEIAVVAADGTAPGFGKDFYVVTKAPNGQLIKSDLVKASTVKRVKGAAYQAEVQKVVNVYDITVPATVGAKASYQVQVRVFNAGSLSVLNTEFIIGHYTFTQTGGLTASDVVDGLIANLNANMSKRPGATATTNPFFTFSKAYTTQTLDVDTAPTADASATVTINGVAIPVALLDLDTDAQAATKIANAIDASPLFSAAAVGTVVTITAADGLSVSTSYAAGTTGTTVTIASTASTASLAIASVAQPIDLGRAFGRPLEFDVVLLADDAGGAGSVGVRTPANVGKGTGKQIATMEYFYRGERGDQFRNQHFPFNWSLSTKTLSDPAATYNAVELNHSNGNDNGINIVAVPKELTIAIKEAAGTTTLMDALIVDVNTFVVPV